MRSRSKPEPTLTADLISLQNKIAELNKTARELTSRVKFHKGELKALEAGRYSDGFMIGADFIAFNLPRHATELAKFEGFLAETNAKIAAIEAVRTPIARLPYNGLLTYFSGTGAENARCGLELLALCLDAGCWVPNASRRVQSVLDPSKAAKKSREAYKEAFKRLENLFLEWDATRPAPTFTKLGTSPTITATIKSLDAVSVDVCPIEQKQVEFTDEKGKKAYKTIVILHWPAGTVHGTSRYSSTNNNLQCQACGHAIKNAFNWVPLVLTAADGTPKSLWVGRDCSKSLFGIELDGELEIEGGKQ